MPTGAMLGAFIACPPVEFGQPPLIERSCCPSPSTGAADPPEKSGGGGWKDCMGGGSAWFQPESPPLGSRPKPTLLGIMEGGAPSDGGNCAAAAPEEFIEAKLFTEPSGGGTTMPSGVGLLHCGAEPLGTGGTIPKSMLLWVIMLLQALPAWKPPKP